MYLGCFLSTSLKENTIWKLNSPKFGLLSSCRIISHKEDSHIVTIAISIKGHHGVFPGVGEERYNAFIKKVVSPLMSIQMRLYKV